MSIFFTDQEKQILKEAYHLPQVRKYYWATLNHAARRAANPGLITLETTTEWWYVVEEFLTAAAMALCLKPDEKVKTWLRDVTLSVVHRSEDDWIGPFFRDHDAKPALGHLETAHIVIGVAVVLDLVPDIFSEAERAEITQVLRERGIPMCQRWIERNRHLANWRAVMASGVAVAAAVINDAEAMEYAAREYRLCIQALQPDGSYGESLQYANYCIYSLMMSYEALVRRNPHLADELSLEPYVFYPRWVAQSLMYVKPLAGWDEYPRARCANFNDSAATFRPTADLMLQIAARGREKYPVEAGLARWLFDTLYHYPNQGPFDRATFGLANNWGFLVLPFLVQAAEPLTPEEANLPTLQSFSVGDVLARDRWGGKTVLAVHGGKDPLYGPGHLHGDLNSFILAHNNERLLADPGHSCYRNLIHDVESASYTHNTCTFVVESGEKLVRPEDALRQPVLLQSTRLARPIENKQPLAPVDRGGRHLLAEQVDEVIAIGKEAAALYGYPIEDFSRIFLLIGSHILFVVDYVRAAVPVKTTWNFLLNNRDGMLDMKVQRPENTVLARRGDAAMKLIHFSGHYLSGPFYGYIHDMYHPLPGQSGEGKSGSGYIMRWSETRSALVRTAVHGVAMDDYGGVAGWHQRERDGWRGLESPGGAELWGLKVEDTPFHITLKELVSNRTYAVEKREDGEWRLAKAQ